MDEFEKIRAFSEEMSRQTEQAAANEKAELSGFVLPVSESSENKESSTNPNFLQEWTSDKNIPEPATKSLSKTFWLVLALTTVVLIALIVIFWLLLRGPIEKGEVISIAPTPNAVKVKPENPGGVVIPDKDKEIYTRLTQDTVPVRVEKLVETQEETPIFPPVSADEILTEVEVPPEIIPVITEEAKPQEVAPAPKKEEKKVQKVEKEKKRETVKKTPASSSEKWRVQLFSSSDKAKVESTWKAISVKHKKLLSNMPMDIEKAEISGKGTFYRLKVGDFSTKDRATNLCAKLKKQHQDCLPVK